MEDYPARKWRNDDTLLKLRLVVFPLVMVHSLCLYLETLSVDYATVPEPEMRKYSHVKYKLITFWFNTAMCTNVFLTIYEDFKLLYGGKRNEKLNQISDLLFTSITLPSTFFGGTLFWRVWSIDPNWIRHPAADNYISMFTHHRLHTMSLAVVVLDLILVNRKRPKNIGPNLALMTAFWAAYCGMASYERARGVYIYPAYGLMGDFKEIVFCITGYIDHLTYFLLQWPVYSYLWSKKPGNENKMGNSKFVHDLNVNGTGHQITNRDLNFIIKRT